MRRWRGHELVPSSTLEPLRRGAARVRNATACPVVWIDAPSWLTPTGDAGRCDSRRANPVAVARRGDGLAFVLGARRTEAFAHS
jgi:hypothetical protein